MTFQVMMSRYFNVRVNPFSKKQEIWLKEMPITHQLEHKKTEA